MTFLNEFCAQLRHDADPKVEKKFLGNGVAFGISGRVDVYFILCMLNVGFHMLVLLP